MWIYLGDSVFVMAPPWGISDSKAIRIKKKSAKRQPPIRALTPLQSGMDHDRSSGGLDSF